jgi:hypothetical protein
MFTSLQNPRGHLRAVRHFVKSGDGPTQEFSRELDAWEDYIKGRSLLALGSITVERLIDYSSKAARILPGTRSLFPAGDSHNALMFGPLLIENGMTRLVVLLCILDSAVTFMMSEDFLRTSIDLQALEEHSSPSAHLLQLQQRAPKLLMSSLQGQTSTSRFQWRVATKVNWKKNSAGKSSRCHQRGSYSHPKNQYDTVAGCHSENRYPGGYLPEIVRNS